MIKTIEDFDLKGKRVFIRVDFNVPIKEGKIKDDTRIKAALPTIEYAIKKGAKVILASHLGRPDGEILPEASTKPAGEHLSKLIKKDVYSSEDCVAEANTKLINDMKNGDVLLLENLRFNKGETKNGPEFSKKLAKNIDIYINDAFGTAHRAHASTYGVAELVKHRGAGFLMMKEVKYLSQALENPKKPYIAILGGAKVSDKINVIKNLIPKVDSILIGGAMAYTFLKAKGLSVGKSKTEDDKIDLAKSLMKEMEAKKVVLKLPTDHVESKSIEETSGVKTTEKIDTDFMGVDIGPKTVADYSATIKKASTIVWNGPMGVFEVDAFAKGTEDIAKAVASTKATSIVGGGDSVAAINKFKLDSKITHISTGGGASLELLEGKKLPGIAILEQ